MNANLEAAIQEAMSELDAQLDDATQQHSSICHASSGSGSQNRTVKSRLKKKSKK